MTYAIAAAGTGGHVYPGLAVAEALLATGIDRSDIVFVGGSRLESTIYPAAGFPFVRLELRGLRRSLSVDNLTLPDVIWRAARQAAHAFRHRLVQVVLAMGGYVTVPVGWGSRRAGIPLFLAEQNAVAGLANRAMARWAEEIFLAFPHTRGIRHGRHTGNPIRRELAAFSRSDLRPAALGRYQLDPGRLVVGVFGGSLGAGAINRAIPALVRSWAGPPIQVLQLAGEKHAPALRVAAESSPLPWRILGFEPDMQYFFAACDLVIARAGGSVAEITATETPSVLVPGSFGGGHQIANAEALAREGACRVVGEGELRELREVVEALCSDPNLLRRMAEAARRVARPRAAADVAAALRARHG